MSRFDKMFANRKFTPRTGEFYASRTGLRVTVHSVENDPSVNGQSKVYLTIGGKENKPVGVSQESAKTLAAYFAKLADCL